jgi:hypothetical protein
MFAERLMRYFQTRPGLWATAVVVPELEELQPVLGPDVRRRVSR